MKHKAVEQRIKIISFDKLYALKTTLEAFNISIITLLDGKKFITKTKII